LPKEAARAALAVMTAPAADTVNISRLENMFPLQSKIDRLQAKYTFTIVVSH
jgi:hypothetical protein